MKKNILFLGSLLIITSITLTACASTNSADNRQVEKEMAQAKQGKGLIQVIQGTDRLRVIAYSDACFRSNGQLTSHCAWQLNQAMKTIKSYGNSLIQVVAYTDDLYDPKTATEIAQDQADTVTSFLWKHGIEAQRLHTIAYGAHGFIASNRSVRSSSFNRRVEIILAKN
jgi:outer membrane protein OmpA-like peptidoglycan-associated protein